MVNAHAVDQAALVQIEQQRVRGFEHVLKLDAHAGQFGHFKKTAPVDLFGRVAPPAEPVMLAREQGLQRCRPSRFRALQPASSRSIAPRPCPAGGQAREFGVHRRRRVGCSRRQGRATPENKGRAPAGPPGFPR
jgi:hypothetical protein